MISFLSQIKETTRKPNCQSYNFLKWKKRNCFVRMGVFPKCKNIKLVGKEKTKQYRLQDDYLCGKEEWD